MSILRVNDIQRATTGSAAIVFDDPVTITTGSISASVLIGSLPGAVTIGDGTIGKEKLTNDARDWVNILNKPSGLLSSSAQLPTAISGTFITPAGVTSSATIFTSGIFSGSGAGLSNIPNSALVNSSITINGTATALGSSRTLVTADISESTNLYYTDARVKAKLNTDGVVSSSGQINYQSVTGQPSVNTLGGDGNKSFTVSAGIFVTASGGADGIIVTNDTANYTLKFRTVGGTVSSSAQVQAALPSGIVSSSTQVVPLLPAGTVSSSTQTKANLPDGTVSASAQYPGWVTASSQIDVRNTTGIATIATTGSNTFIGNQTVSGSVTVTGNLTVQGTSSVLYTTSSQLNVGTNKIIIGTNQTLRFGGLSVIDSASVNQSGSLYWDSVNNTWIYENISGSGYNSAILIGGPKNTGALGNETGLTAGRIPVAVGNDHIDTNNSSGSIRVDFTSLRTDIENSLYVTGSITASAGVSGVSYTTLSNIPSGIISSSTQVAASVPAGTVSSSGQINAGATANFATAVAAQLATVHSASYLGTATTNNLSEGVTNLYYTDARVKTKMNADNVMSASYLGTATTTNLTEGSNLYFTDARAVAALPNNTVSSSLQVIASLPAGTVSSSGQINLAQAYNTASQALTASYALVTVGTTAVNTDTLPEGSTNLYYTDARVKTKLNAENVHSSSYLGTATTTNLTEGINLYFTNARVVNALPTGLVSSSAQTVANIATQTIAPAIINATGAISGASVQTSGNATIAGTVSANKLILNDNVISENNLGQKILATSANYLYLYTGTNGISINNQGNTQVNVSITDAGVVTTRGALTVGSPGNDQNINFGGSNATLDWASTGAKIQYSVGALQFSSVNSSNNMILQNGMGALFNYGITGSILAPGVVSSSAQYPGWVTSSSQIDYNSIQNKLSGVVSSSTQVAPLLPASTVSSSTQVTAFLPNGTISSSAQYPGWVTASSQIDYTLTQNTPVLLTGSTLYTNTLTSGVNPTRGIILGVDAGYQASESQNAIYIGEAAGYQAYDASYGIFIGAYAGYRAAEGGGIYIGSSAGADAYSANSVIFMGEQAGQQASSASFSILLGNHVGYNAANTPGIGTNNIIIGNNITLPDDTSNAINLGGIIFATGAHSNIAGNPYSGSQANGKVGIGVINPVNTLQIQGTVSASSYTSSISNAIGFVGTASFATTASSVTPSGLPAGTVSSSAQYPGWVTASSQIDYNSITNKLSGVISSSAQFNALTGTSASYAATSSNLNGGTVNYIPLWNSPTLQASSIIYQTGGQLGINNTVPSGALHVSGTFVVQQILEKVNITASAPPATFNVDVTSGSIFFRSGSTTANWTTNFRGDAGTTLNSMMYNGQSLTLAVIVNQGASTVYSSSTYQIDGASVTPKWQNGLTPTSSINAQDIYSYTIIKLASASYNVFASQTKFA